MPGLAGQSKRRSEARDLRSTLGSNLELISKETRLDPKSCWAGGASGCAQFGAESGNHKGALRKRRNEGGKKADLIDSIVKTNIVLMFITIFLMFHTDKGENQHKGRQTGHRESGY